MKMLEIFIFLRKKTQNFNITTENPMNLKNDTDYIISEDKNKI